jgi:tRNA(Arg) A34 adenosine deaminase TadA
VKVAAKRIYTSLPHADSTFQIIPNENVIDIRPRAHPRFIWNLDSFFESKPQNDADFMKIAQHLARQVCLQNARYESDRPIAALLVSKENEILGAAINTNAKNRTLHAEMNLIEACHEQRIPKGARIYSTLKPCKMCAGMIVDSAEELSSLRVVYAENDPGKNAQNTALDRCTHPIQLQL